MCDCSKICTHGLCLQAHDGVSEVKQTHTQREREKENKKNSFLCLFQSLDHGPSNDSCELSCISVLASLLFLLADALGLVVFVVVDFVIFFSIALLALLLGLGSHGLLVPGVLELAVFIAGQLREKKINLQRKRKKISLVPH